MGLHKMLYNLHRACKLSVYKDSESDSSTSIPLASIRKQAIGKRIARAKQSLLKSTPLKVKILSTLDTVDNEKWHPIGYSSRALRDYEKRYAQIEKKTLSTFFGVERFHEYSYGRRFIVSMITHH